MAVKLYDRQRQPIPRLRGYRLNTLNQTVEANDEFDLTLKSIKTLNDVFSTMTPSDGDILTYDTTNGWQSEVLSTVSGSLDVTGDVTVSNTAATISSGTGTPEGAVTAPIGSLFTRTDGGAATTLYVKETGAGNTGWVGK